MTLNFTPAHFIPRSTSSVELTENRTSPRNPLPDQLLFLDVSLTPAPTPSLQFSSRSHFIGELVGAPLHFFQLIAHISVFRHFSCGCVRGSRRSGICAQLLVSLEDSEKGKKQCG